MTTSYYIFDNYACSPTAPITDDTYRGGMGLTRWNTNGGTQVPANGTADFVFTTTHPNCFNGKNACLAYFRVSAASPSTSPVWLNFNLNGHGVGGCCLPGTTGLWNWQSYDFSYASYEQGGSIIYPFIEAGTNTISLVNANTIGVGVTISDFEIYNSYAMCTLDACDTACTQGNKDCNGGDCYGSMDTGTIGNLGTGVDYPCNFDGSGSISSSFIQGGPYDQHTLNAYSSFTWDFDFSPYTSNYQGGSICLVNFNKIWTCYTYNDFTTLTASVQSTIGTADFATFYLVSHAPNDPAGTWYSLYPSYNIMNCAAYDDRGPNTITLTNHGPASVKMVDGPESGTLGDSVGLNVYRFYKNVPLTQAPTITCFNAPSTAPVDLPSGSFRVCATDYQGDTVRYEYNWNDGNINTIGPFSSGQTINTIHTWTALGYKTVNVRAEDAENHVWSGTTSSAVHVIPDEKPTIATYTGPSSCYVYTESSPFTISASDPQGDSVKYEFDWGDTHIGTMGPFQSGTPQSTVHTWNSTGTMHVIASAIDSVHNVYSYPSTHDIQINPLPHPPNAPCSLSGATAGTTYLCCGSFAATTDMPQENFGSFNFNWGDQTSSNEVGWPTSTAHHVYTSPGTMNVTVQVSDKFNQRSDLSTFVPVTVQAQVPSQYYVSSIVDAGTEPNGGGTIDLQNVAGSLNDGNFGELHGYTGMQGAWLVGSFNQQVTGHIEICGYGFVAEPNAVEVYVSNNTVNSGDWIAAPSIPPDCTGWIDCGETLAPFSYVKVRAFHSESETHLYMDSIRVTPTATCTLTITPPSGGSVTASGTQPYPINTVQEMYAEADPGYHFSHWEGDASGSQNPYPLAMDENKSLSAMFVPNCETTCELSCQIGCELCQTTCELACQVGCEVSCQSTCELACQTGCEVSCQTGCEVSCQSTCELACQVGCQVSCQTGCEVSCQSCNTCQSTCELSCQTQCEICEVCNTACYAECQTECQLSCQTGCEVGCQTTCELACQTGCETSCQTGCEVACQSCQTCEGCEWCELFCEDMCMYCETQ